jgi:hypothetical protein
MLSSIICTRSGLLYVVDHFDFVSVRFLEWIGSISEPRLVAGKFQIKFEPPSWRETFSS